MKLKKELRFEDVRRICIDNNLYTNGTNEEYNELMEFVEEIGNITDYRLLLIGRNILNHSITDYSLDTIITLLNSKLIITVDYK